MRICSSFGLLISFTVVFCVKIFFLLFEFCCCHSPYLLFMLSSDEIVHTNTQTHPWWCIGVLTMLKGTSVKPKAVGLDSFGNEQSCCLEGFSKLLRNIKIRNIVRHCLRNSNFFLSLSRCVSLRFCRGELELLVLCCCSSTHLHMEHN